MPINQKYTAVIVDDGIFDSIVFLRSIFSKKAFDTQHEKTKFIPLSALSAAIPADRLDDFGVYIYVFEKIDTAEEYLKAFANIKQSPNIEEVLLFCQTSKSFSLCEHTNSNIEKCHNIAITFESHPLKTKPLAPEHKRLEHCLSLYAFLSLLLQLGEGALDDFSVLLKLNYKSIFSAVQYEWFGFNEYLRKNEHIISVLKEKIEELERKEPLIYKHRNFAKTPDLGSVSELTLPQKQSSEETLKGLATAYSKYKTALEKTVHSDIEATRYVMAATDASSADAALPECLTTEKPDVTNPLPTGNDLLKKTEMTELNGPSLNIEESLRLAHSLTKQDKPKINSYLITAGIGIVLFLLCVGSVYLTQLIKNGFTSINRNTLLVILLVPVGIILAAGICGFIINSARYAKIKKLISEIRHEISSLIDDAAKAVARIRIYLNKFITVFYNHHAKDHAIEIYNRKIASLEYKKKGIISDMDTCRSFAEFVLALYDISLAYERENAAEEDDFSYRKSQRQFGYYESTDEAYTNSTSTEEADHSFVKKLCNRDACVKEITENCSTLFDGENCFAFEDFDNPWISQAHISLCENGGTE